MKEEELGVVSILVVLLPLKNRKDIR